MAVFASVDKGIGAARARLSAAVADFVAAERDSLPLWLPVALGAGIAAWFLAEWQAQRLALAAALLGLTAAGLLLGRRLVFVPALLALLGMAAAEVRTRAVAHPVLAARGIAELVGEIASVEPRADRDVTRIIVAGSVDGAAMTVRLTLRGPPPAGLAPGARVAVRALLAPPAVAAVPGGYDFARRAWFAGIGATGVPLGSVRLLAPAPPRAGLVAAIDRTRARLNARITLAVPGPRGAMATAFVTGDQGGIPLGIAQAMRDAGLAHLLSISGLHIAVVVGGTLWLVRRGLALVPGLALAWPLKTIAAAAGALVGLGYTLLAGAEVPTVRSIIAALIVLLGVVIGREALSLRLLAAAAFGILLLRPEAVMGASFQLSFAAVTALVALSESAWGRWLARHDEGEAPWLSMLRRLAALLVTGLVAEAALAPIGLYHFGRSGLYGALANIIAIPWSSFVVMPALALGLLADALGLGDWAWAPAGWTVGRLIDLAQATALLPGAVLRTPMIPDWAYALMVAGGLWLLLWRSRVRRWGLPVLAIGGLGAATAPLPDLLVSGDGRQVALAGAGPGLALLRPRASAFLVDMWSDAVGSDATTVGAWPGARCSHDVCVATARRGGRDWRVLLTISREHVDRRKLAPACAAADLVISDRRLPQWCRPRWLRLDGPALAATGALTISLSHGRVLATARGGDHPWQLAGTTPGPAIPAAPSPPQPFDPEAPSASAPRAQL